MKSRHLVRAVFAALVALGLIAGLSPVGIGVSLGQVPGAHLAPMEVTSAAGVAKRADELFDSAGGPPGSEQTRPPRGYPIPLAAYRALKANPSALDGLEPSRVDDPNVTGASPRSRAPSLPNTFQGIGYTGNIPPDNATAAGPNHVVEMVNSSWRVFNKDGSLATALVRFCGTGGWWTSVPPSGVSCFDPKIVYDQYDNRWVMLAVAKKSSPQGSWYLIATSWTSDPTALWCVWSWDARFDGSTLTTNWADFPGLGIDDQAVYITSNQFSFVGDVFQHSKIRIVGKAQLYANTCASISGWDFWDLRNTDGTQAFTVQPAHTYGTPGVEFLVNSRFGVGSSITLWSLTNPLGSPPGLSRVNVAVGSYSIPPPAAQCAGAIPLDTGDTRLLNAVYRNGDLWTAHTVACGLESCLRLIRMRASGPTVLDDFSWGATGFFYYYPAVMTDAVGHVYVVFNRSSLSECAGVRFTGRRNTDAVNNLQASSALQDGLASYVRLVAGLNRFGDYSGIGADPSVPNKVWLAGEYVSSMDLWGTWIGGAQFDPTFADVPVTDWGFTWIELLYPRGITAGCATNPLRYCPDNNVTRREMAVFIVRSLGQTQTGCTGMFSDVPTTDWGCGWIERLYQLGITAGCATNPARYCPDDPVTRAQMAVFLNRAVNQTRCDTCGPTFADVPSTHWAYGWIERLFQRSITAGCATNPLRYCPDNNVSRREMAVFLIRNFFP